jgi:hypothetical protein
MEKIIIALNTPLHILDLIPEAREGIIKLEGKLIKQDVSGVFVDITKAGTDRSWLSKSPLKKTFIPFHKIDHIGFE